MRGNKIKNLLNLKKAIKEVKTCGKCVVFTNGCFDILHLGHICYLKKAKSLGDVLVVAINSDSSVKRLKGKNRPITKQNDRAQVIAALECVDYVTIFNEDTPIKVIKELAPDILIKGADWQKNQIAGADFVEKNGGKVTTVQLVKNRSTTKLIEKIVKAYGKKFN